MTQKWRKLPAWMLPLLVAFVFLPTVAGLFGRSFWLFELATHFRPQLLLGAAFFALVAVISRRPGILLIAMLAGAVNAVPLLAYATASVARGAPEHTLRILFANVNLRNDNYAAALDMIAAEAPDVVGLAEVDAAWVAGLSALKARYPYSVERPQEGAFGLLLYSRFPIAETEGSPLVQDGIQAAISVETELLGETVSLVVAHLMAPMSGARAELRNAQIKKLATIAGDGPQIIFGDLNITPWSPEYSPLQEAGFGNAARGVVYSPTWPAKLRFLGIPIDHVLLSNELEVREFHAGRFFGSDHLPVVADIAFAAAPDDLDE